MIDDVWNAAHLEPFFSGQVALGSQPDVTAHRELFVFGIRSGARELQEVGSGFGAVPGAQGEREVPIRKNSESDHIL